MFYDWKEADDLTVQQMEDAKFAQMINSMVRQADTAFPTIESALEEHTGVGLATMQEVKEQYRRGEEVLKQYACFVGERTTIPFIKGVPTDNKVENAVAWYLVDSGHIAQSPAYRFVRFYRRKEQIAETT